MPASPLKTLRRLAGRALNDAWALSLILGVLSFVASVLLQPPFFVVVLAMSIPFFAYVVNARWKHAVAWIVFTIPFQFYFKVGGLTMTLTELYMFLFGATYFLSRIAPARSVLLPSLLVFPTLYSLTPFLPCFTGKFSVAKEGVRLIAAVFFCPQPSRRGSIRRSLSAC